MTCPTMSRPKRRQALAMAAAVAALCGLAQPQPARACGGFFCDQATPVLQQAERIVFVDHGDDRVTAIIEIMYSGPAERFAWVLPVAGVPEVSVSSSTALGRLQGVTEPQLQRRFVETVECLGGDGDGDGDSGDGDGDGDGWVGDGVTVEAEGAVGPYDYAVISVDENLPAPVDAAIRWLGDNGYDVTDLGPSVLAPYLESGMNLIAFRLTKGNSAGSIRPVQITYEGAPAIPIRPTAVAAADDMGIMVFVLGADRAVPLNYADVRLNEVRFDWSDIDLSGTYRQVVSAAVDEAGGKAFVTQYASAEPDQLDQRIFADAELTRWQDMSSTDDAWDLLESSIRAYANWDGLLDAVAEGATLPAGVTASELVGCPRCYQAEATLDVTALRRAIYEQVVVPMVDAQALLNSRAYLTRLFTTMSAGEMNEDPVFGLNPDLPEVAALHTADIHTDPCAGSMYADLGQGHRYWGSTALLGISAPWPVPAEMPAALDIRMLGNRGDPVVLVDNHTLIEELLPEELPFDVEGDGPGDDDDTRSRGDTEAANDPTSTGSSGGGCSASRAPADVPWVLLAWVAMLTAYRRRARSGL